MELIDTILLFRRIEIGSLISFCGYESSLVQLKNIAGTIRNVKQAPRLRKKVNKIVKEFVNKDSRLMFFISVS